MKNTYESPSIEVLKFNREDIISCSGFLDVSEWQDEYDSSKFDAVKIPPVFR